MAKKSRETLGEGNFLRLVREGRWEFAERNNAHGAVAVVAVTPDERLILVDQYRPAVRCHVIDLPAGLTGDIPGEEHEAEAVTANRELVEETGYEARSMKLLASCPTSPGLSSEVVSYFQARGVKQIGNGGGVEHEDITVLTPKLSSIRAWLARQIKAGKLIDTKVYAGLYFALRS